MTPGVRRFWHGQIHKTFRYWDASTAFACAQHGIPYDHERQVYLGEVHQLLILDFNAALTGTSA